MPHTVLGQLSNNMDPGRGCCPHWWWQALVPVAHSKRQRALRTQVQAIGWDTPGKLPCPLSASRGYPRTKVGMPHGPGLPDRVRSQRVDVRALRRLPKPGSKGGKNLMTSVPKKSHLLLACPGSSSSHTSLPGTSPKARWAGSCNSLFSLNASDPEDAALRKKSWPVPMSWSPPLAGILEGHLTHPFAGKTWFSLALEIWPGRFSGVSVFIHTHPHHFDVQDCQNANPLRDLLHPVHSSDIPWPEMPATMWAPWRSHRTTTPQLALLNNLKIKPSTKRIIHSSCWKKLTPSTSFSLADATERFFFF